MEQLQSMTSQLGSVRGGERVKLNLKRVQWHEPLYVSLGLAGELAASWGEVDVDMVLVDACLKVKVQKEIRSEDAAEIDYQNCRLSHKYAVKQAHIGQS
jgi:hypothetical protein